MKLEQASPNRLFSRSAGHGTCPGFIHRAEPGERLKHLRHTGIGTEHQRQETTLKHDYRTWSPNQTVQPKQSLQPGVASARSDDSDSRLEDDGIQNNSDATVRPVTLPEVWTVVLNSLRQVVYCHVKSGIACFQMPENPELPDDLKFENGTSSGSGNLSQKRRSDCKRRLSNRPEYNKSKISRDNHHQRSSQYVENQVMVKSPSC